MKDFSVIGIKSEVNNSYQKDTDKYLDYDYNYNKSYIEKVLCLYKKSSVKLYTQQEADLFFKKMFENKLFKRKIIKVW